VNTTKVSLSAPLSLSACSSRPTCSSMSAIIVRYMSVGDRTLFVLGRCFLEGRLYVLLLLLLLLLFHIFFPPDAACW
jgi:hypothetical protein